MQLERQQKFCSILIVWGGYWRGIIKANEEQEILMLVIDNWDIS